MSNKFYTDTDKSEVYAMVSFGHKEQEGEKNANFFFYTYSGMVDAAKLIDPDIKIEWHGPNAWDPVPEIKAIQELADHQVDGIMVSAADKTALDPSIDAAIRAGVPVINFDADSPASARLIFVGTDNYKAGYLAGQTVAKWLGGQGDVAVSTIRHAEHLAERLRGFVDAMHQFSPQSRVHVAYDSGRIDLDELGRQDFSEYRQSYIRMIQAHPEVRGLFATYASPGAGATEAVEELDLQGKVYVLTFDFDEDIIKLVRSGKAQATVGQDPYVMGFVSMILLHAARHAPEMPTKDDSTWCLPALTDFLDAHPTLQRSTTVKLKAIISQLEARQGMTTVIDTGARILGLEELLDLLSRDFEDMRDSISEKIASLGQEVEVRKQAERKLRQLNEELEQRVQQRTSELVRQQYILDAFMDNIPDSIYFKDLESRITRANKAHAAKLGLSDPDEEVGKSDFDFFPEEQARAKYEQEQEIIRTGQPVLNLVERSGVEHWVLTTKMPLRDENGEIIGTFGISRDITELKQAQRNVELANKEVSALNEQLQEENLRMSAELDIARRIQEMILPPPEELQQIEGLDIVGFMQPADEVGGDYYDVLHKNGTLHIGIGDVTGHGLESGVLMLMTQTAIRTLIDHGETDPVKFVNTLNRTIFNNVRRTRMDKSLTLALVNFKNGQLKLVGQHEEMLLVRADGEVERMNTLDLGIPLGLEKEIEQWVNQATVELGPGEGIVLYTDGITEAVNDRNELYGLDRLCEVISQNWHTSAEEIKHAVVEDVTRHIGHQTVYDDLTLVVLKQP